MGKETKTITTEEIVARFRGKNNKELDAMFWSWIDAEKVSSLDYFLVIDNK